MTSYGFIDAKYLFLQHFKANNEGPHNDVLENNVLE